MKCINLYVHFRNTVHVYGNEQIMILWLCATPKNSFQGEYSPKDSFTGRYAFIMNMGVP